MKNPPKFKEKNKEIIDDYIRYAVLVGKKEKSILRDNSNITFFMVNCSKRPIFCSKISAKNLGEENFIYIRFGFEFGS